MVVIFFYHKNKYFCFLASIFSIQRLFVSLIAASLKISLVLPEIKGFISLVYCLIYYNIYNNVFLLFSPLWCLLAFWNLHFHSWNLMFSLFLENSQVLSLQMSLPHSLSSLLLQLRKIYIRLLTESLLFFSFLIL